MAQHSFTLIVVLALPEANKDLIAHVKTTVLKMTGNHYFPSPTPTLAAVDDALAAFESAETSMGVHKGITGDRAAKKSALVTLLKHLRNNVQWVCEANIDNAAAIAESAGMRLKKPSVRFKSLFAVTQGLVSGDVTCDVKAAGIPATYYWSYGLDQKSWTSAPDSMTAKVTISGLSPGQTYHFRYRTLTRKGLSDFSQTITFLVK